MSEDGEASKLPNKKVVIIGNSNVGKTCIINTAKNSKFEPNCRETIGCDTTKLDVNVDGYVSTLSIYDTAGQEAYQGIAPHYARKALACLLVYDITDHDSFETMEDWKELLKYNNIPKYYLVGNKVDLEDERQVLISEAIELAEKMDCKFYEVSARTTCGIEELFQAVASDIHRNEIEIIKSRQEEEKHVVKIDQDDSTRKEKNKCCH